jgi:thermitase
MPAHRAHQEALRLAIVIILSLPFVLGPVPLRAQSSVKRAPLCREDGVCLPPPLSAGSATAESAPEATARAGELCPWPLLVKRAPDVPPTAFQHLLTQRGLQQVQGLLTPGWWRVCLPDEEARTAEIAALERLPGVALAAPDGIAHAAGVPNDIYYGVQWGLPMVGAPAAWDITTGGPSVMIAVIDSGVDYFHPDLPSDMWLGWDYVDGNQFPYDEYGHGTHVTGIAVAVTGNAAGVAGLCPNCSALVVRVLNASGLGSWSAVADGITYAVDAARPLSDHLVINLSLGGSATEYERAIVVDAIDYALAGGALMVAAAGNLGPTQPMFPASAPGVIAVSATDGYDRPTTMPTSTFYSQYGDLGAPGGFVFSTVPLWAAGTGPYGEPPYYRYMSGTSMASPFVAAAAGLIWSVHPEYTPLQVQFALYGGAEVPAGWDALYGVGRLNVAHAVSGAPITIHRVFLPLTLR